MQNLRYEIINDLNESSLSVIMEGSFTGLSAREFQKFILPVASSWDLNMDLKGVNQLDISGINILVGIHEISRRANRSLNLSISSRGNIYRLFELTQMDKRLNVLKTIQ